ncbi:hypothetical protein BGZ94_000647 [Podila epigama]|nr:hypothetical protein BGZ94_000647 [Podila epigama]
MGVFGEKHTSLTREQKRQLIYQADTQKLRPTEVCAWVMATWGLRIARVTVYSILHKQRASLMEGYTYESIAAAASTVASLQPNSKSKAAAEAAAAKMGKGSSRRMSGARATSKTDASQKQKGYLPGEQPVKVENKYRTSSSSHSGIGGNGAEKRHRRSVSMMSDISRSSSSSSLSLPAVQQNEDTHGTPRWEGQLKRVREPASAELDHAMVDFLKSPASVDALGRRLSDAELQAHALRLAKSIPSAQHMRCSFGWLRHFKRRLGVHWRPDPTSPQQDKDMTQIMTPAEVAVAQTRGGGEGGRWVIENEHQWQQQQKDDNSQNIDESEGYSGSGSEDEDGESEEYYSSRESIISTQSSPRKRVRTTNTAMVETTMATSSASILQQPQTPQSILATLSAAQNQSLSQSHGTLFNDSLPPLHILDSTTTPTSPFAPLSDSSTTIDPKKLLANSTVGTTTNSSDPTSAFGMSVDGKMRKVPSKEEAYDMLQSLLLYYEQDHCSHAHYLGLAWHSI